MKLLKEELLEGYIYYLFSAGIFLCNVRLIGLCGKVLRAKFRGKKSV